LICNSTRYGIYIQRVDNFNFTNNLIMALSPKANDSSIALLHFDYTLPLINKVSVVNNIAKGSSGAAFIIPYVSCSSLPYYNFSNNLAGSSHIGFEVHGNPLFDCIVAFSLTGFDNYIGVFSNVSVFNSRIYLTNLFLVDCHIGFSVSFSTLDLDNIYYITKSYFNGFSRPYCLNCYNSTNLNCNSSTLM